MFGTLVRKNTFGKNPEHMIHLKTTLFVRPVV